MTRKCGNGIRRAAALALLCLLAFSLTGCAQIADGRAVVCNNDEYSLYSQAMARAMPDYDVSGGENAAKAYLDRGMAAEVFDVQAVPALAAGAAEYWYPHYLATVVIAVDRDRTQDEIKGWGDLYSTREAVGFIIFNNCTQEAIIAAIAYGMEGEAFTLDEPLRLFAALKKAGRLINNSYEQPVLICLDYQAAALIRDGRNIEVVIPVEGTLTYEKGLMSNAELKFTGDVELLLLEHGLRLLDGRCDAALYPGAAAYENARRVTDFDHLNTVSQDVVRRMRREVLHIRMYTGAEGREHQYFALIYIVIITLWSASVVYRTVQKRLRIAAFLTGIILVGWIIVRLIKYQLSANSIFDIYLWFSYYIFQLSLPVMILWMAWALDKPEDEPVKPPKWLWAASIINGALIVLVMSNFLHNWVFRFDFSNPNWPSEYGYDIGFYLVQAGCYAPLVIGIIMMLYKGRQSLRKSGIIFVLLLFGLLVAYTIGYILRIPIAWESDVTMVVGLFVLALFETSIRSGMIPVNTKYAALFAHSPLRMQLADKEGQVTLSAGYASLHDDENTLTLKKPIAGGHVLWKDDIAGLNRLNKEIEDSVRRLQAANAVLAEEERIKREVNEESARTQLMEQLEAEISKHTARLSSMLDQIESAIDQPKAMARITLLMCYIKRRCNLFFRERETPAFAADELAVYMDELAEIAGYSGVRIIITSDLKKDIPVRRATLFYDFLYNAIHWATWLSSPHMLAHLGSENGNMVLRLLPSEDAQSFQMESSLQSAVALAGGEFSAKDLDDVVGISLCFPERTAEGGEGNG